MGSTILVILQKSFKVFSSVAVCNYTGHAEKEIFYVSVLLTNTTVVVAYVTVKIIGFSLKWLCVTYKTFS